ncbi:hypothetical protein SISNIDRAFT_488833 [Sistotremastrum niveocremeum HHB9708]|uniref:Nucleoside phosphatase GDA1/CD39 n=1 Tax=Sistotremastrum niveocremeum HHB9708 TaxID=1314777 RepID=A0A164QUE0_9AGAM|nr:hypothetical protein SISNIDRAFT_488833 [Sistotremastrum niveocremeum HHB9708]
MPPPSLFDPWLASRRFGIVIDAGSSGSRLQIYSWLDARALRSQGVRLDVLPKVEKGAKDGNAWMTKVEPGLSTFSDNVDGVGPYLAPLLAHAWNIIPPSLHFQTPIFLLATAGMRLLPPDRQTAILRASCEFLRFHSNFQLDNPNDHGPCGSHVRIISGEEEGLFGWIAINYLMDGFQARGDDDRTTYGFLDMGGASTQIAFEPQKEIREAPDENLHEVRLRLLDGSEMTHDVFVTTWLGYGTNQARERYVGQVISGYESSRTDTVVEVDQERVPDPCLPRNLIRKETPVYTGESTSHSRKAHVLVGTGSFENCLHQTNPLLNKTVTCDDPPCLFNGVHVPAIDFSVSRFIGVSEYWYSSEHIFGLGGTYDFAQYERAASEFCQLDWSEIMRRHERSRKEGHLGGDGEEVKSGEVVAVGQWGPHVELSRLEMQCFKAAWIVNVLHEGIGIPRVSERKGATPGDKVKQKAAQKGLGAPPFQSLDTVGETAITWTLGKMVVEASREVPPLFESAAPIHDPMHDDAAHRTNSTQLPQSTGYNHLKSPFYRADTLSYPILAVYFLVFFGLFIILFRMRRECRKRVRRFMRRYLRHHDKSLEEGKYVNGNGNGNGSSSSSPTGSRPSSPEPPSPKSVFQQIRRIIIPPPLKPVSSTTQMRPIIIRTNSGSQRHAHRISDPLNHYQNGAPIGPVSPRLASFPSMTSTDTLQSIPSAHPLYAFSQSRNSSQVNLVPRQPATRGNSGTQTPDGAHVDEG